MTTPERDDEAVSPTVRRIVLGAQLRRLREARGISRSEAGFPIRASESKISRMELGKVGFKIRDVEDLLTNYGVTEPGDREPLMALALAANEQGWWQQYSDVQPSWFQAYLGLEEAAGMLRTYEVQFIPGLLQTSDYARAVIMLEHGNAPRAELDRRIELRMRRQKLLDRAKPPQLWAVVDEAALRRAIGGREVLGKQIDRLIEATERPNIRVQVIPFAAGGHAAAGGAFTILRFPDQDVPDMVYMEQLTGALYLEKRDEVDHYAASMERLCVEAEPPTRTAEILTRIRKQL